MDLERLTTLMREGDRDAAFFIVSPALRADLPGLIVEAFEQWPATVLRALPEHHHLWALREGSRRYDERIDFNPSGQPWASWPLRDAQAKRDGLSFGLTPRFAYIPPDEEGRPGVRVKLLWGRRFLLHYALDCLDRAADFGLHADANTNSGGELRFVVLRLRRLADHYKSPDYGAIYDSRRGQGRYLRPVLWACGIEDPSTNTIRRALGVLAGAMPGPWHRSRLYDYLIGRALDGSPDGLSLDEIPGAGRSFMVHVEGSQEVHIGSLEGLPLANPHDFPAGARVTIDRVTIDRTTTEEQPPEEP
jgi:hypothetical protein